MLIKPHSPREGLGVGSKKKATEPRGPVAFLMMKTFY